MHFVFNVLLKQSTAVMPAFFQDVRQKERRDGEGGILEDGRWWWWWGGVEREERWRGCWHALVSNLFESIAQFICFVSTATAEDNQTRRPLDSSYCPPMHTHPPTHTPPLYPSLSPPTPFFHVTCWLKERQGNSQASPKWGNVRKGTHIKTMLSWRYSMVQKLQTNTWALRIYNLHTHTLLCTHW